MRVGQYCNPRYLYLFPYFSSTKHVRIDGNDREDKMATTIYCLCGIGTAQQIFMKHSNSRMSSASQVCNKLSKSSSQQPPRADVFKLAKRSTNTSFRQQQLRHTPDNPPSPHLLIGFPRSPPRRQKLSVTFSFKVDSIKKYLR